MVDNNTWNEKTRKICIKEEEDRTMNADVDYVATDGTVVSCAG